MINTDKYRTILIKDIDSSFIGKEIIVSGWIQNIRDHGGVLFLDPRYNSEILQTISNDNNMFKCLAKEEVNERFQSLFNAFKYGCSPHGGWLLELRELL